MRHTFFALALLASSMTHASLMSFVGSPDTFLGDITGDDFGFVGTELLGREVVANQQVSIKFTALFSESGWENAFFTFGDVLVEPANIGDSLTYTFDAGVIDFAFVSTQPDDSLSGVINGQNEFGYLNNLPDFLVVAHSDGYFQLGFNDGYTGDGDYDDFVIGAQVTAVPVPAAAWLFGTGLIGLAGVARTRRVVASRG